MVDLPVVVVRGEAQKEVPPELAVFSVTVTARDSDRKATLTRLAERAAGLRRALDRYPDAIERRETGGIQISPELKRGSEKVVAYTGSVSTTVTVNDFEVLGPLLLRLGNQEQTSVSGPWWQLRPDSTAGAEMRRAAIADALARAREYADAVGSQVHALIEISDEGTDRRQGVWLSRVSSVDESGGLPELELDPQPQTVSATVVVRVAITEPTSL